jgi:hypothetical protein
MKLPFGTKDGISVVDSTFEMRTSMGGVSIFQKLLKNIEKKVMKRNPEKKKESGYTFVKGSESKHYKM